MRDRLLRRRLLLPNLTILLTAATQEEIASLLKQVSLYEQENTNRLCTNSISCC
jgi:hypothetical protein